jgi:hypothetical protein
MILTIQTALAMIMSELSMKTAQAISGLGPASGSINLTEAKVFLSGIKMTLIMPLASGAI